MRIKIINKTEIHKRSLQWEQFALRTSKVLWFQVSDDDPTFKSNAKLEQWKGYDVKKRNKSQNIE